eukprot:g42177.t1
MFHPRQHFRAVLRECNTIEGVALQIRHYKALGIKSVIEQDANGEALEKDGVINRIEGYKEMEKGETPCLNLFDELSATGLKQFLIKDTNDTFCDCDM